MFWEGRDTLEEVASGAHGPRISLSETYRACLGCGGRTSCGGRGTACQQRSGSGSEQGRSWNRAARTEGSDRKTASCKEGQEGVTKHNGTENTSIRIPPGLQQALEVALVCGTRLRRTAARRCETAQGIERKAEVCRYQLDRYRTRG